MFLRIFECLAFFTFARSNALKNPKLPLLRSVIFRLLFRLNLLFLLGKDNKDLFILI